MMVKIFTRKVRAGTFTGDVTPSLAPVTALRLVVFFLLLLSRSDLYAILFPLIYNFSRTSITERGWPLFLEYYATFYRWKR